MCLMLYMAVSLGIFLKYEKKRQLTSLNIKYIDNQLVTVIKIQMICKCKYKTI